MGYCRRYKSYGIEHLFFILIHSLFINTRTHFIQFYLQWKIWSIAISLHCVIWWFEHIYKIWKMSQIMCTTKIIVVANWPASAPMESHVSVTSELKWHLPMRVCACACTHTQPLERFIVFSYFSKKKLVFLFVCCVYFCYPFSFLCSMPLSFIIQMNRVFNYYLFFLFVSGLSVCLFVRLFVGFSEENWNWYRNLIVACQMFTFATIFFIV